MLNPPALANLLCAFLADRADSNIVGSLSLEEWQYLTRDAVRQGVAPLLLWKLKQTGGLERIPLAVQGEFEKQFILSAAKNHIILERLCAILTAFSDQGVPVVVLKGASLASSYYPDPALRPMQDLDLLVRPEHLSRGIAVLKGTGCQQRKATYHLVFEGPGEPRIPLELHWSIFHALFPMEASTWFWQNTMHNTSWFTGVGEEQPAGSVFSPTAQILFLATHLYFQHGLGRYRLIWLYDLDRVIRASVGLISWDSLLRFAIRQGWQQALYEVLSATRTSFFTPLPADLLLSLDQSQTYHPVTQPANGGQQTPQVHAWTRAAIRDLKMGDRLRILGYLLFPTPAYLQWKYNLKGKWRLPIGYLRRWLSLGRMILRKG